MKTNLESTHSLMALLVFKNRHEVGILGLVEKCLSPRIHRYKRKESERVRAMARYGGR